MRRLYPYIFAVLSGALIAAALPGYNMYAVSFVALIPLFIALKDKALKESVAVAATAGLVTGLIYYQWSIQSVISYSAATAVSSVASYIGLCLFHMLWYAVLGATYFAFQHVKKGSIFLLVLSVASLWTIIEWLYQNILPSYPWIIVLSYTQWNNLYLLQWTSVLGMWFLTFFIVACNMMLFLAFNKKQWQPGFIALVILLGVHSTGYVVFQKVENEQTSQPSLNIVVLQENINASDRWNDTYADTIAHRLLSLNTTAASYLPEIIVWSETAIPWTFRTDDDLVTEALKRTFSSNASHLVGMLTSAGKNGEVFNSLYYIEPDGRVSARYDKKELLSFLEKPLLSFEIPFLQSRYSNILPGERSNVMNTQYGNIGALICNETLSPYAAAEASRNDAQMLVCSSNDGWFYGTTLTEAHFALTRMRAVETRKDIVVNANRGISGIVRASGSTMETTPSNNPHCMQVVAHLSNAVTIASDIPDSMVYVSLIFIGVPFYSSLVSVKKRKDV